jgi:pimeloyl-ACP methyl ester carboxylesterase
MQSDNEGDMIDIIFINGLSCGDGTQDLFVSDLKTTLGDGFRIHRPDLSRIDRTTTKAAVEGIAEQFRGLKNPIVVGFSLGGLWALLLARQGFTDQVICISPAVASNWLQIDPLRLRIFGASLLFGKNFQFNYEISRKHLMLNVPEEIVRETSKHFFPESSSLIRDYGFMRPYTKLSQKDVQHIASNVKGLMITGAHDRMTHAKKQTEMAALLGIKQVLLDCGHTPQFGPHRNRIQSEIAEFLGKSNVSYPDFTVKKAG